MIRGPGIAKRHAACTFENFAVVPANKAALKAARSVADGASTGVILIGPVGRGKTHLLAAMAKAFDERRKPKLDEEAPLVAVPSIRELIAQAVDDDGDASAPTLEAHELEREAVIEFWPMLDLVSELRNEIRTGEPVVSTRCRTCDLLVLDDFGQERMTDFVLEEMERIIDWRYRNMLPIAVSTNLTIEQMADARKYGDRSISRWAESCEIVKVGGIDHRTEKKERT